MMHPLIKKPLISLFALASCLLLSAQEDHHDHDHGAGSDQVGHSGHDHHNNHDHDHSATGEHKKKAGPNGGKTITSVEPHFELFIQDDRKARITFLDEADQAIAPADQKISGIGGSRSNPTRMAFKREGDALVSSVPVPEGNSVPLILRIQSSPDARPVTERIYINLNQCPTCAYREYACICDHAD